MSPLVSHRHVAGGAAPPSTPVSGRPARWRLAIATLIAVVAALLAPVPQTDSGPVATLDTSMVEMLGTVDPSSAMTLSELRQMMANNPARTSAGQGIDVAVIDTGVVPVTGLDRDGKVLHGPDLSFEGSAPEVAYLDTYGHGTHMAGIIAGERDDAPGIAPGARIVSLKVAGHDGITTVPQVVAAIDWVVDHHDTDGLNIRVLNLSLGQAGVHTHIGDELSAAVERAWDAGIVVVVAAGNRGETQRHLDSPAIDPYVISVGALEQVLSSYRSRYAVPAWSATGNGNRNPDATAPGRSIASYRVPGSTIDNLIPKARYGTDFFLGSGTSQAAAVTSGVAAAMLQYHPEYTPDMVKATLTYRAIEIDPTSTLRDGEGAVNGPHSVVYGGPSWVGRQNHPRAAGSGKGLVTPTGATWSGGGWAGATWSGATWSGKVWSGATWSGATWSGATWSGATWSGATWSGATWSGATWSGATWSGATWSGATWSGNGWS
jgi:serine protease AprX